MHSSANPAGILSCQTKTLFCRTFLFSNKLISKHVLQTLTHSERLSTWSKMQTHTLINAAGLKSLTYIVEFFLVAIEGVVLPIFALAVFVRDVSPSVFAAARGCQSFTWWDVSCPETVHLLVAQEQEHLFHRLTKGIFLIKMNIRHEKKLNIWNRGSFTFLTVLWTMLYCNTGNK